MDKVDEMTPAFSSSRAEIEDKENNKNQTSNSSARKRKSAEITPQRGRECSRCSAKSRPGITEVCYPVNRPPDDTPTRHDTKVTDEEFDEARQDCLLELDKYLTVLREKHARTPKEKDYVQFARPIMYWRDSFQTSRTRVRPTRST